MTYLRNVWHQAGWADELGDETMLSRTIMDEPLLFFRDASGQARAILDRCPHRFAPLSAGTLREGVVTCGYHGLAFNGAGECVHNPHGRRTASMAVRSYSVVERYAAIWIWMGDPSGADADLIPNASFIDETPETARIKGLIPIRANYLLGVENIMDLSHTDYLHPITLGGMMTTAKTTVSTEDDQVFVEYFAENCDPPQGFQHVVPPPQKADIWIDVRWYPAGTIILNAIGKPTGAPRLASDGGFSLHAMTPESSTTTHYFFMSSRKFKTDDVELTARMKKVFERAFVEEDKPMLEKQQARIGEPEFWSLKPVMLSIDGASAQVRRRVEKMAARELEPAAQ